VDGKIYRESLETTVHSVAKQKLPEPQQFEKMLEEIDTSGAGQAHHCADLVRFLAFAGCRITCVINTARPWRNA